MHKPLKDKRILITAGPTWVPIDPVRVISNCSSGLTGLTIARRAVDEGADVTLLLGPVDLAVSCQLSLPAIWLTKRQAGAVSCKVIRFKYFDELLNLLKAELKIKKYDIIVHAAAVSDYRPVKIFSSKINSDKKELMLYLKPTIKILEKIRHLAKETFLVMFKLEVQMPKKKLVDTAYNTMRRSGADLIIANNIDEISGKRHRAYIIDRDKNIISVETKEALAKNLLRKIGGIW